MSQFAQTMKHFAATYGALPHFNNFDTFHGKAIGAYNFTLVLGCTDIGAMVNFLSDERELTASYLSLSREPMDLNLVLAHADGTREAVRFHYNGDVWACASQPRHALIAAAVRFARNDAYEFADCTLMSLAVDYLTDTPQRHAA